MWIIMATAGDTRQIQAIILTILETWPRTGSLPLRKGMEEEEERGANVSLPLDLRQ